MIFCSLFSVGNFIKLAIQELDRECRKDYEMGLKELIRHEPSLKGDFVEEILERVHRQADLFNERQRKFLLRNAPPTMLKTRVEKAMALNKFPNDQQIKEALRETIFYLLDDFLEKAS